MTFLLTTRESYDAVARDFAGQPRLAEQPFERAMLAAFAELVSGGPVVDVGCGPGHVTAHLHALDLDVSGVDLSPEMVAVARETYPGLAFGEGSMTALDLADGSVAGLAAVYSIIHVPPAELPTVFAEFHRVLAPGGHVLLVFQVGDERIHVDAAFGRTVALDAYRLPPAWVADRLTEAGFAMVAQLVREPMPGREKVPQAYLVASKGVS